MTAIAVEPALDDPFPVPARPPKAWFSKPDWLEPGQRLTITDEGQAAAYFYERGACLLDGPSGCWTPPPSPTAYLCAMQGEVATAEGEMMRVGVIGAVGGHADPSADVLTAFDHYQNEARQRIVCSFGDDEHGGWIAGALVPGTTHRDVALLRRSSLSGDWRQMPTGWFRHAGVSGAKSDGYDLVGCCVVTQPGLPLIRAYSRQASAAPVYLGGEGGVQFEDPILGPTAQARFEAEGRGLEFAVELVEREQLEMYEDTKALLTRLRCHVAALGLDDRSLRAMTAAATPPEAWLTVLDRINTDLDMAESRNVDRLLKVLAREPQLPAARS